MQKKDGIQFHRGLPDPSHLTKWFGPTRGGVLVLDDLMEEGGQDKRLLDLFTKDSHHRNITVLYLTQDLSPLANSPRRSIAMPITHIVAFKNPRDQTGIRTILLQAFPDRWRQVLRLFKRITSRPFGYLMLDVHPASDDRYRLWSHLTPREGKAQVHTRPVVSLPFENALQRERERQRRQREGGQHTDISARMDTSTLSPAGVGSPTASPPSMDLSSMTDMVTELTGPIDRAQLDQEIEDCNLTYPDNVDDAVTMFSLPPVAGTGTADDHHGTAHHHRDSNPTYHVYPNTPYDHRQPNPTRDVHPNTSRHHRHDHHRPIEPPYCSPQRRCRDKDHHLDGDDSPIDVPESPPNNLDDVPGCRLSPRPILPLLRRRTMTTRIDGGD